MQHATYLVLCVFFHCSGDMSRCSGDTSHCSGDTSRFLFLPDASCFPLSHSLSVDPSSFAGFSLILNQLETPKLTRLSLLLDTIC